MTIGAIEAGKAAISLFADDKQLNKDLRGVKSRLQARMNAMTTAVVSAIPAMTTAAIGSAAAIVKGELSRVDAIGKLADRADVSAELIQTLGEAANRYGMEQQHVSAMMLAFSKRLGEAAMGMGEAKVAYEELGLSAADMAGNTEAAFFTVIDTLSKIENRPNAAALGAKLFSDVGGKEMIDMLTAGSESLREIQGELERTGQLFKTDMVNDIQAFNDASASLFKSFKANLSKDIIGTVQQASEALGIDLGDTEAAGVTGKLLSRWATATHVGSIQAVRELSTQLNNRYWREGGPAERLQQMTLDTLMKVEQNTRDAASILGL